ncbi:hypothetical protein NQ317_012189 [Molorchus minor]|uniref:Tc1-like transposase DDE domain-containing protein n=1 Tax=Molorchus minor TaxID=1323400 RepID=A0ABQ9K4Z5_9CUCU|nr:hypothetical protein NQ317_012189 [Molorchus minor]
MNEKIELVILRGENMNGERYKGLCVRDIVIVPYAENVGGNFILVDDNATRHRASIVTEFLEDHGINRMNYSPLRSYSPAVIAQPAGGNVQKIFSNYKS